MLKKITILFLVGMVTNIFGQQLYNFQISDSMAFLTTEMLYETPNNYISIGYYDPSDKVGVHVYKYDKHTGALVHKDVFFYENKWIFVNGRTRIYDTGRELKFAVSGNEYIFQLNYDYIHDSLVMADTISNPYIKDYYINDFEIFGDTTIYYATIGDSLGWITRYPDKSLKFTYVQSPKPINSCDLFIRAENGNYIFFGGKNDFNKNKFRIAITEMDSNGNIIWEKENTNNSSFSVDDIIVLENNQVLILATAFALDQVQGGKGFFRYLYKFDIHDKKFIWQKYFTNPLPGSQYAKMVKSQNDIGKFFMVNTEYLDGSTIDSHVVAGHVTKFDGDGNYLWKKKYFFLARHDARNIFNTIIPTSDGNYLIGGELQFERVDSWLVKIDEDGNILPIDTTSTTFELTVQNTIPEIKIYPNPASHSIIINQGEITDMTYQLIDMNGGVVKAIPLPHAHHNVVWDISDVVAGTYILSMKQGEKLIGSRQQVVIR